MPLSVATFMDVVCDRARLPPPQDPVLVPKIVSTMRGYTRAQFVADASAGLIVGIVQVHGVDGLLVATLMAGVILVAMGLLRLGVAIKFIPHPLAALRRDGYSTVTLLARLRGWSTFAPRFTAM